MTVSANKPVWGKVTCLAAERDGNALEMTWKVPPAMKDEEYHDRAEWLYAQVNFVPTDAKVDSGTVYASNNGAHVTTEDATATLKYYYNWVKGISMANKLTATFSRSWFHPLKKGKYLDRVSVGVWGNNSSGKPGETVWTSNKMAKPYKPTVTWEYAAGSATVTIKSDEGDGWREWYDTMYRITLRKIDGTTAVLTDWTSTRNSELSLTKDLSTYISGLSTQGKYVQVKCEAYSRGMGGDSATVTATRNVAYPNAATLGTIKCDKKTSSGRIEVPVTPGAYTLEVQLQRRHGATGNWSDVSGATDNWDCKSLYDSYGDADPQPGEHVYYRVKTTRDGYTTYSAAKRADCLYTAKPKETCSATCKIAALNPNSDGTQVQVVMAWKDSTANDGCELSWSELANGWNTTDQPNTAEYTGADSPTKLSGWSTRTMSISNLTPGTTYYIRVRRYKVYDSGNKVYSAYDLVGKATPVKTESAEDDRCGIISTTPSKTGTSCTVVVGYTEDNTNTGTELSWSTSSVAWSNSSATLYTATSTASGSASSTKWAKQVSITLSSDITQGTTYYIRARRYKTVDSTTTYSPYSEIQKFTTESAADDQAFVVSVTPGTAGKTATVVVGFNEDNPNTGTELQWSADRYAWQSNVQPESLLATWARATWTGGAYSYKQTSFLRNLEPGKTYYIKARRYMEAGGTTTYSKWSPLQSFTTPRATAANDKCGIVSVTRHSDNLGANVVVGWTEDTANDGTELTWSTDADAWTSNKQPESMQATWSDKTRKSTDWAKTQTISLHGLERGESYYIRARRYKSDDEGTTYSPYSKTVTLTMPAEKTDVDVRCGLVSVTAGDDGTSATVVVGWSGDHTGCEVTWSKDPNAWESSEQPQSTKFDWSDKTRKSNSWSHTSTLYLRGLEEGETYYVRARSYFESDDGEKWSDYTGDRSVTPYSSPASVALSAPSAVARGESIELYWTVEGELEQAEWRVHKVGYPKTSLASGKGSLCHASIPKSRYGSASSISLYVEAGYGGGLTESNSVTVGIADVPKCEIATASPLTVQPASFEVYTDDPTASLLVTLASRGVTMFAPDGDRDQLAGDAVWTASIRPDWEQATWGDTLLRTQLTGSALTAHPANGATYMATVTLPVLDYIYDGGLYTFSAQTVEPVAGLVSKTAKKSFRARWAHQAPRPPASITVVPSVAGRSVTITLAAPTGAAETDVYDVYRKTPTGYALVAFGLALDDVVTDMYAPYGRNADLKYRVCTRTADGDLCFRDFAYTMDVNVLRVDWDGGYVELPYNIGLSESKAKSFESRGHVDGSTTGRWNKSIESKSSYSSDVISVNDYETANAVRRLGEHAGACFVRDATGMAFQANVDVPDLSRDYASPGKVSVRLDAAMVETGQEFWLKNGEGAG